jgi:hypothetical protein
MAASGSSSTAAAGLVVPLNSSGMPEQTSSRQGSDMGSGIRKQKSHNLKEGKARQASSSVRAGNSRNLCPLPDPNRCPGSELSPNGSTPLWTPKSFAEFLEAQDSASQTSSPGYSNGSHSPGLENWSQYPNYATEPQHLPSSAVNQQIFGQYPQTSDSVSDHFKSTVLPLYPAIGAPNSNYQASSTKPVHNPFTEPHTGSSYGPPQQQMSLNRAFNFGVAGSVPPIGSTDQFGGSIPTQALVNRDLAGRNVNNSNHTDQEMFLSKDEINSALSDTARLTPAPESFKG